MSKIEKKKWSCREEKAGMSGWLWSSFHHTRDAQQMEKKWWELSFLIWIRTFAIPKFGWKLQTMTGKWKQGHLLYATPFGPVYELHTTIDVVTESHTYGESHCNKWNLLRNRRRFNKAFQSINNLITRVGWDSKKETW